MLCIGLVFAWQTSLSFINCWLGRENNTNMSIRNLLALLPLTIVAGACGGAAMPEPPADVAALFDRPK